MNSDVQIAGDPLAVPHLLPPVPAHPSTVAGFAGLAREVAADRAAWAPLVRYDATTRWYHRLRTGPGYEVWLLSWLPGQGSGLHDHGPSFGVFTVLEGELTERTQTVAGGAERRRQVRTQTVRGLRPGTQHVFAPGYVHEVVNDALVPAVSLHVYFPGLTEMPMHHCAGVRDGALPAHAPAVRQPTGP
ncbi:cysteine dioxygenase family protein [Streptomyces sp. MST-110588]|uniref:cysteine dioxygenase n=1 Tax=Streptomyces sp. MST-110588 TaxID=2833628 RepID=UPI001F5D1804|nr:cysteine dioxygenase family protein [Streptomyces sp. MST-110588]UNO41690.1 cysteine dioxygenase family protein [Streptomyces sp. MST-110588]